METSQSQRAAIITLHTEGYSISEIARQVGVRRSTVTRWIERHLATGATGNLKRSGRPRCTTAEEDEAKHEKSIYSIHKPFIYGNLQTLLRIIL